LNYWPKVACGAFGGLARHFGLAAGKKRGFCPGRVAGVHQYAALGGSPAALSADGRGTSIWRPAKSVVFAGVHQYAALEESLSRAHGRRCREGVSGAAHGEHWLYGGGYEVVGEAFCVAAQFLGRGAFPMIGPQHGADVVQVTCDAIV
jgi:hypothetical protein